MVAAWATSSSSLQDLETKAKKDHDELIKAKDNVKSRLENAKIELEKAQEKIKKQEATIKDIAKENEN
jgi:hypothetical protein